MKNIPGNRSPRPASSGFTLLELLVVLAILAMIAAFAGPQIFKHLSGARSDAARVQIGNLSAAIDLYRLEVGTYPPTLEALVVSPGSEKWNGPYLRKLKLPKDPWGNEYVYRFPGQNAEYDLLSLGSDNTPGGSGEDADISVWD